MTDTPKTDWSFQDFGPEFDSHVVQHLPGYADVQNLIAGISRFTVYRNGHVADLGASTGTTADIIGRTLPDRNITFHLYDEDRSMLDVAEQKITGDHAVRSYVVDLETNPLSHRDADLTLCLWTLQFLHPKNRVPLLAKAREAAADTGAILVASKTIHSDTRWADIADSALDEYKSAAGVDDSTRLAKTRALRGTMAAETPAQISANLLAAGWHSPAVLWSWHSWTLIGAYASPMMEPSYR